MNDGTRCVNIFSLRLKLKVSIILDILHFTILRVNIFIAKKSIFFLNDFQCNGNKCFICVSQPG